MKFTLNWLKDYLETEASLNEITDTLNAIGLEVEGVEDPAEKLGAFTVAEVVEAVKHPDADKLKVCTVNTGTETITVVCGAPNARTGMKAVLGRPGDYVPGLDVTLALRKVRGVESNGMMCSAAELELGEDHDGILDLPADAPVGAGYAEWAGLDDPVIEIAITPNRQDCLGVYGIARDLAAAGLGTLKHPTINPVEGSFDSSVTAVLDLPSDASNACSQFVGRSFTGVNNGESPDWVKARLKAVGQKPISALVDVTNYISIDLGRPLHVYDADKLSGNLRARLAEKGEKFTALDDKEYECAGGETVIADGANVHGFGGIIGGLDSGCTAETKNVVLEVAYFDPIRTAVTGRKHNIITDARYRFERGVDPEFLDRALDIASQMILDHTGGNASHKFEAGGIVDWQKTVAFRPERIKTLGGIDIAADQSKAILESLGFTVTGSGPFEVEVPSWRRDVDGEADLVEEVLRINGYDNIPSAQLPAIDHKAGSTLSALQKRSRAVKRRLAASGLNEAVTWSFMNKNDAALFADVRDDLVVDNPISSELDYMRPSILSNLLKAAQNNSDRGVAAMRLFEVGPTYSDDTEKGQSLVATGIRTGKYSDRHWNSASEDVSVFDTKADAIAALEAAGAPVQNLQVFREAPVYFHPGRSGTLRLGPKNILANFGELHPRILKALDVKGPAVGFEVYLDKIPGRRKADASRGALEVSNLQAANRDFAFIVDADVASGDLVRAIKGADKTHIVGVDIFDLYQGKGIPDGKKSLAVAVSLEPSGETFTDQVLDTIAQKVIAAAEKSTGAILRG
jgi:phenylalanyl-tRNA synthetase beta chain